MTEWIANQPVSYSRGRPLPPPPPLPSGNCPFSRDRGIARAVGVDVDADSFTTGHQEKKKGLSFCRRPGKRLGWLLQWWYEVVKGRPAGKFGRRKD